MRSGLAFSLAAVITLVSHAWGQTSLYIPGFDPQPVAANELGVGADGETTWLLAPGVSSGTLDGPDIFGPATLIAGPTQAHLIYDDPAGYSLDDDCGVNGDIAECTAVYANSMTTSTYITEETAAPFEVQGGLSSITSADSGSPTSAPSAGSSVQTGASQTSVPSGASQASTPGASTQSSSTSGAPLPSGSTNGVAKFGHGTLTAWLAFVASLTFLTFLA
ncbi:hypothetical protein EW026_g1087 [Hermanssonia centrifuga]|uniref:Uncharacterized protein n=1 Tax=Hermanssonia centrifuga TaxID=98765 RepID=A0A4S4KX58_9APHY|nr:hypothetical protein EW026_g1087 [Hermanssonia centrifuga]